MTTTNRLFNIHEYHRMADCGIFHPEERVELIDGEIIKMAAKNPAHSSVTNAIQSYLEPLFKNTALIRTQDPIQLNDCSEPEPDIAVVRLDKRLYYDRHPTAADTYLIIEVADTSLKYDTTKKAAAYARSGIKDYWVVDAVERQIYFHAFPQDGEYSKVRIVTEPVVVGLELFPDIKISTRYFFPI